MLVGSGIENHCRRKPWFCPWDAAVESCIKICKRILSSSRHSWQWYCGFAACKRLWDSWPSFWSNWREPPSHWCQQDRWQSYTSQSCLGPSHAESCSYKGSLTALSAEPLRLPNQGYDERSRTRLVCSNCRAWSRRESQNSKVSQACRISQTGAPGSRKSTSHSQSCHRKSPGNFAGARSKIWHRRCPPRRPVESRAL